MPLPGNLLGRKITEKSCVRHPPSYLVGLLTQRREPSFFLGMPQHGRFLGVPGPAPPFFPPQLTQKLCRLTVLWTCSWDLNISKMAGWVSWVVKACWNKKKCLSTSSLIHLTMSKFLHKNMAPGSERPAPVLPPLPCLLYSFCPQGSDEDVRFSPGKNGIYSSDCSEKRVAISKHKYLLGVRGAWWYLHW